MSVRNMMVDVAQCSQRMNLSGLIVYIYRHHICGLPALLKTTWRLEQLHQSVNVCHGVLFLTRN